MMAMTGIRANKTTTTVASSSDGFAMRSNMLLSSMARIVPQNRKEITNG